MQCSRTQFQVVNHLAYFVRIRTPAAKGLDHMKFSGGIAGAFLLIASFGIANATPTLLGNTTNPTGIDGVVVDGIDYNVVFSTTTFNTFTDNSTLSIDSAAALASALNT
jgi:hypothetical protein